MTQEPMAPTSVRSNEVVRIADLTVVSDTVEGVSFQNCLILGPAVVHLTGSTLADCSFDAPGADALLWIVDPKERPLVVGAVRLDRCVFNGCRFKDVGFALTEEEAGMFRNAPVNP